MPCHAMLCHAVLHSVNVAWPNTTCTFVCSPMRNHSRAFEALRSYFFLLSHLRYIRCTFCLCLHDSSAAAKFVHFVFLLFRLFWHRSMCGNLFAIRLEATSTATNADKKMCDELTAEAILIIKRTWKTALIQSWFKQLLCRTHLKFEDTKVESFHVIFPLMWSRPACVVLLLSHRCWNQN